MADLTEVQTSQVVEITDGSADRADVATSTPAGGIGGLVVREAQRGQATMAASIPVTLASDQTALASNYEYAEDAVHGDGDTGAFVLAVRNDVLASLVTADGDYAPFQVDALGALYVNISNASDISVVTNFEYAEDAGHTTADVGAFVLAVRNDTPGALAGTDLDYAPLQVDDDGYARVTGTLSTLIHGQTTVATAGTAVILFASATTKTITIKALDTNNKDIYVGDSTVDSTNGYVLAPGEAISMEFDHAQDNIFVDSAQNGEGVSYIGAT